MSNQSAIDALDLPASIKTIMDSWSLQTGYPIVTVRRNYDSQSAIVTQVQKLINRISPFEQHILNPHSFHHNQGTILSAVVTKYNGFPALVDSANLYNRL